MQKWHHANIIFGTGDCKGALFEIFEKDLNFKIKQNPDFLLLENETFGIDDARNFGLWAIGKPLSGDVKVSLIVTNSITVEAQNALLKLLEEPPLGTYIFINLASLGNLLETLLSRIRVFKIDDIVGVVNFKNKINGNYSDEAGQFLKETIGKRFAMVRTLSSKENKTDMKNLIKDLEEVSFSNHFGVGKGGFKTVEADKLKNILLAKAFVSARGSSPKMILEWLSCMI